MTQLRRIARSISNKKINKCAFGDVNSKGKTDDLTTFLDGRIISNACDFFSENASFTIISLYKKQKNIGASYKT